LAHYALGNALHDKGLLDEAIAEFHEAIRINKDYPEVHYNLGNVLFDKGQLDEATAEYREAIRINKDYALAHCNLGVSLVLQGAFREAVEELRLGNQLGSRNPHWLYPSAQWLGRAERLLALDDRLPLLLKGQAQPADAGERMDLAFLCQRPWKQFYAASSRWFAEAFAADRRLAADLKAGHRYAAACAAALAGCGQGKDAAGLGDEERARLRRQALDWLRQDLALWRRVLEREPDRARLLVVQQMQHWQQDPAFAGVRGPEALARLPAAERAEWHKLWADVADLLSRAGGKSLSAPKAENRQPPHPAAPAGRVMAPAGVGTSSSASVASSF
jgi:tetratricopeptide (TPR) repeat protein